MAKKKGTTAPGPSSQGPTFTVLDERFYRRVSDGRRFPRCTSILSTYPKGPGFDRWLASMGSIEEAEEYRDFAGEQGTWLHEKIDEMITVLQGGSLSTMIAWSAMPQHWPQEIKVKVWKKLYSFASWWIAERPEVLHTELTLFSEKDDCAGTTDIVCRLPNYGNQLAVLDWKSSSRLWPHFRVQVRKYADWLEENMPELGPVGVIGTLRLGSRHKAGYEFKVYDDPDTDKPELLRSIFAACRVLWQEGTETEPRDVELPLEIRIERPEAPPAPETETASA